MSQPSPALTSRLPSASWRNDPATQAVFALLAEGGFTARAVGGIVRNTLLGLPASDVDIATDATPHETLRLAERAGLKTVPTGLAHGTVTVIAHGQPYEVTTLRRDIATDGRHATVAFTDDWAADAARRDFTINALYCDADGTLFDPLGGLADLAPVRVRFIGSPAARIAEDYLRILRFFRFSAAFVATGALDPDGLAACIDARAGLARLSGERISSELCKLLTAPHAIAVTRALVSSDILSAIVPVAADFDSFARLAAIEGRLGLGADAVRRLAALAAPTVDDAVGLAARLRLSAADRDRLVASARNALSFSSLPDLPAARIALYRMGQSAFTDATLLAWAHSIEPIENVGREDLARLPQRYSPPSFPLQGRDLIALGATPGPGVGRLLATLEADWLSNAFKPARDGLLAQARQAIANDGKGQQD